MHVILGLILGYLAIIAVVVIIIGLVHLAVTPAVAIALFALALYGNVSRILKKRRNSQARRK